MEFGRHGRLKICWPYGRVGSSPTASTGALGSAHRFRRKAQGRTSVVVNAHCLGAAVAKSPASVCEWVLWGRAARVVSCVWLVSPFVGAAPTGVAVVASSKDSKHSLRERPMRVGV